MSANAKLVQQAYDAFGRGDIATVIGMLDANVEWISPRALPHGGEFTGPEEVGKFFEGIGANWDTLGLDMEFVEDLAAHGVVAIGRGDGTLKNGESRSYGLAHVFDVRNGKIIRFREYVNELY